MKKLVGVLLLLAISPAWAAKPNLLWCQGCSPDQGQALAVKAPLGTIVYVGDAINKTVNVYSVDVDVNDRTNPPTRTRVADSIAPDPSLVSAVNKAITYYNSSPVGWVKRITVYTNKPSANNIYIDDPNVTVYDIVNAGRNQNYLNAWLNAGISSVANSNLLLGNVVQGLANFNVLNMSVGPNLVVPVVFKDGSYADAIFDNLTDSLKIDPSTAIDSHGNNVPYLGLDGKIHNLGGIHDFEPTYGNPLDQQNFLHQAQGLGVLIVPVGSGSSGSSPSHWVCVYDEARQEYTCTSD